MHEEEIKIRLNIDSQGYDAKPSELGLIRTRLCRSECIYEIAPDELIEAVKHGKTFTPAALKGTKGDSWESQQIICIDVDNDCAPNGNDGESVRSADFLSPEEAREGLQAFGIVPYFIYATFSYSESHPRYRIVIVLDRPFKDKVQARVYTDRLIKLINAKHPGSADPSGKDNARMFLGSKPDSILYVDRGITPLSKIEGLAKESKQDGIRNDRRKREAKAEADRDRVLEALTYIPADGYKMWRDVGMALKHAGFSVSDWDDWSRKSDKYEEGKCQKMWDSFKGASSGRNITLGTLFKYAKEYGYQPQWEPCHKGVKVREASSEHDGVSNPHYEAWKRLEGYSVNDKNQILYGESVICYGTIRISEEVHYDNGFDDDPEIFFRVEGITESGKRLEDKLIPSVGFRTLNWVISNWGHRIVPRGTAGAMHHLSDGLLRMAEDKEPTIMKCCTGYLYDDGKPKAYLHAEGCIGKAQAICDLHGTLSRYKLSGCSTSFDEKREAFQTSLSFLDAHVEQVTYPLLSLVYMTPVARIIEEITGSFGFGMFLSGKTENGKSEVASLAMCHFGHFTPQTPPSSFGDTANSVSELSFLLNDSILWVDDYRPGTKRSREAQTEVLERIARASGDNASRKRLDSKSKLMQARPPRCLFLMTGEADPCLFESGIRRLFTIQVPYQRKDVKPLEKAAFFDGVLSRAMSDYIAYIIENYDEVKEDFARHYEEVAGEVKATFGLRRLSLQVAPLITSLDVWLDYAVKSELISREYATEISRKNVVEINKAAYSNAELIKENNPVDKYLSTLSDLLSTGEAVTQDINDPELTSSLVDQQGIHYVGWHDEEFFYLHKRKSYEAVEEKLNKLSDSLGISVNTLVRDMNEAGSIPKGDPVNGVEGLTKNKTKGDKTLRCLFVKKSLLERYGYVK